MVQKIESFSPMVQSSWDKFMQEFATWKEKNPNGGFVEFCESRGFQEFEGGSDSSQG